MAQILREVKDPGDPAVLARYSARRSLDALATIGVTDLLAGGFNVPGLGAALTALEVLPLARRFFARRMIYGPSALP